MKLQNLFRKIIEEKPKKYYNDFLRGVENVSNSTAIYKGEPVDFLYQGLFFSEEEYIGLKGLLLELNSILKKVVIEYKNNSRFREYFPFDKLLEELILIDPGYENDFPMGRFDIFYKSDGNHIFCELNTDGASAMNEVRVIQDFILNSLIINEMKDQNLDFKGFELFYTWISAIINNYKEFNNGIDDKPNIAIIDFKGEGTEYEFREFQKRFLEKGYKTFICDPRELKYIKGNLYYNDNLIKLVYRRATTIRLLEEASDINDFLTAYRDGAICVVGGLVSQIIHNKVLFAILHDFKKVSFLDKRDKEFIKKHIPFTKIIDFANQKMIKNIVENKNNWILKPFDQFAGKGVFAGRDFGQDQWKRILDNIKGEDYILQKFIDIPKMVMANLVDDCKFEEFGFLLGLFSYNNKLTGLYTRVGRKNIIGSIAESYTVPNFIYKDN